MTMYILICISITAVLVDRYHPDNRHKRHDDIWFEYDDIVDIRELRYITVLYEYVFYSGWSVAKLTHHWWVHDLS